MKHAFFTLAAALFTVPAYAAPLDSTDWKTSVETPEGCFLFNDDGSLTVTGNTNGKELHYIIGEGEAGTHPMQNGSGLSVSVQFNTETFLNDAETSFYIAFHNNNSGVDGEDFFEKITIGNTDNQLNLYDNAVRFDEYHTLDSGETFTKLEVDFIIENNVLCCTYSVNGNASARFSMKEVNPNLDWKPSFGLSNTETNAFTVTDISFTTIPEPAAAPLFLALPAFFAVITRRRRK